MTLNCEWTKGGVYNKELRAPKLVCSRAWDGMYQFCVSYVHFSLVLWFGVSAPDSVHLYDSCITG